MRPRILAFLAPVVFTLAATAQTPDVTSWIINPGAETGYGGILSNVQHVQYNTTDVYVSCTCIPGYDIGPWNGNPNTPANQNFIFRITRAPQQNTGAAINTPLGHIGVWRNGVSMFNPRDAMSYMNQNAWHQNAVVVEGPGFDLCNGHPAPNGEYHNHLNPTCLYDAQNDAAHSPIIGYAFDGFPVYGAFGFANADGTGGVVRMASSYRLRSITTRTTYADGSAAPNAGPAVSAQYPLGYYVEDFEFVPGLGELDVHNGRISVTPEYPAGIYSYYTTTDSTGTAAYPYILGPAYYGAVPNGNTGPGSGHNTVPGGVITWNGNTSVVTIEVVPQLNAYPNPSMGEVFMPTLDANYNVVVMDAQGRTVRSAHMIASNGLARMDLGDLPNGVYTLMAQQDQGRMRASIVIAH